MAHDNDGIPNSVKIFMTVTNRLGFPIIVCMWLAYQQFVAGKETVRALDEFKAVMIGVKDTLDKQNKILRHRTKLDE